MLFSKLWFCLTPLLAFVAANPIAGTTCYAEYCGSTDIQESGLPTSVREERKMTNAERIQRELPLNQPRLRADRTIAPRAGTSPVAARNYYIRVDKADGSGSLGWVSAQTLGFGQFVYDSAADNRLIISIKLPAGTTSGTTQLVGSTNSVSSEPELALIEGRDNSDSTLKSGSFQYTYLGSSAATAPGAHPATVGNSYTDGGGKSREAESAIWNVDLVAMSLSPTWINPAGASPASINPTLIAQSTALYAVGDAAAFNSRYPAPVTQVKYVLVPV